jgi:hypothetical protein
VTTRLLYLGRLGVPRSAVEQAGGHRAGRRAHRVRPAGERALRSLADLDEEQPRRMERDGPLGR